MLGHEVRRAGVVDWRRTRSAAREHLRTMNLDIDPKSSLSSHSLAVQQLVAISRAMVVDARVLILDEPTSSLDADEVARLFDVVRALRDRGVAILFVSHFLDQVYEISDRMTVLRNGTLVGEYRTADLDRVELVQKMIGRALAVLEELEEAPKRLGRRAVRHAAVRAGHRPRAQGHDRAVRPRRVRRRGRRARGSARLRPHGARAAALRRGPRRLGRDPGRGGRRRRCAPRAPPWRAASSTPRRAARPRASSVT